MCHTLGVAPYEASAELRAARDAAREAEAVYEAAMERLRKAVIAELAQQNRPADVGRFVGWHPSHVRKLARKADVPPLVDVEPPRRRRREPSD
jgi:predicted urease superfamily metal-dependent hydrolase